jgi:hypothetical protein
MSKRERQTSAATEQKTGPAATSPEATGSEQRQPAPIIVPDDEPNHAQRSQTAAARPLTVLDLLQQNRGSEALALVYRLMAESTSILPPKEVQAQVMPLGMELAAFEAEWARLRSSWLDCEHWLRTAGALPPEVAEDATVKHPAYMSAQDHSRVLALVWRARLELVGHPAADALRRLEENAFVQGGWGWPLRQIAAALRLMHKDAAAMMLLDAADLLSE